MYQLESDEENINDGWGMVLNFLVLKIMVVLAQFIGNDTKIDLKLMQ